MTFAHSKLYCYGVAQEKQRFWTISLSAPNANPPPSKKRTFYFNCCVAASESEHCSSAETTKPCGLSWTIHTSPNTQTLTWHKPALRWASAGIYCHLLQVVGMGSGSRSSQWIEDEPLRGGGKVILGSAVQGRPEGTPKRILQGVSRFYRGAYHLPRKHYPINSE